MQEANSGGMCEMAIEAVSSRVPPTAGWCIVASIGVLER